MAQAKDPVKNKHKALVRELIGQSHPEESEEVHEAAPVKRGSRSTYLRKPMRQILRDGDRTRTAIVRMTAMGYTVKKIAIELKLGEKTVEYHRAVIARDLGMDGYNVALITRRAVALGLVPLVDDSVNVGK